jgi:glycosyltransferase involved in cell wall biosynthesis
MNDGYNIDVVIPAYEAEKYIAETINSVLNQTYPVSSIIVVDDCSTDGTAAIVNAFRNPKIRLLRHDHNQGVSAARNTGLQAADAAYVALVDSDDVWREDKLGKQIALFRNSVDGTGVVYCGYTHINDNGAEISSEMVHPKLRGHIFQQLLSGNFISGSASAVLIKKECIERAGFFRTDLFYGEDWDYWLRLSRICAFDFVDEPLVKIRIHGGNAQHGQSANPEQLKKFLEQELKMIAPWSKEAKIPYLAYLHYSNRYYMLTQTGGVLQKLGSVRNGMKDFAPYHHKYFALTSLFMLLLAGRRRVRKLFKGNK